jgi:hypothetical protein
MGASLGFEVQESWSVTNTLSCSADKGSVAQIWAAKYVVWSQMTATKRQTCGVGELPGQKVWGTVVCTPSLVGGTINADHHIARQR